MDLFKLLGASVLSGQLTMAPTQTIETVPGQRGQMMPPRGTVAGHPAELLYGTLRSINKALASRAAQKRLEELQPEIEALFNKGHWGVLVRLGFMESRGFLEGGDKVIHFMDGTVIGGGRTPEEVWEQFARNGTLEAAPPTGWVKKNTYLWVTRLGATVVGR